MPLAVALSVLEVQWQHECVECRVVALLILNLMILTGQLISRKSDEKVKAIAVNNRSKQTVTLDVCMIQQQLETFINKWWH